LPKDGAVARREVGPWPTDDFREGLAVTNVRGIRIMSVAAAVVLAAYVVGGLAGVDLGSARGLVKIAVVVAAVVVAALAFQAWSHASDAHSLSAMAVALLGGASLASTISTATGPDLYGSDPMALVGTVVVVAAVTIAQVGQTRSHTSSDRDVSKDRKGGAR
jgi:hypothetical protein